MEAGPRPLERDGQHSMLCGVNSAFRKGSGDLQTGWIASLDTQSATTQPKH
jgi:hypothetical protein